jgi:hypothetical protein
MEKDLVARAERIQVLEKERFKFLKRILSYLRRKLKMKRLLGRPPKPRLLRLKMTFDT